MSDIVGKGRRVAFVLVASTDSVVDSEDVVASPVGDASVGAVAVGIDEDGDSVVERIPSVEEDESIVDEISELSVVAVVGGELDVVVCSAVDEEPPSDEPPSEESPEPSEEGDPICAGVASHVSDPISLPCIQHCQVACCFGGGGSRGSPFMWVS